MQVYCRGGDRRTQKLAKDVARFCASKMMSKRLSRSLTITIKFVKGLEHIEGDCEWTDEEEYRPKEFIIRVSDDIKELHKKLRTVCHEMVHVKQYARGEMRQMWRPSRMTKFMGKLYSDDVNYWDTPWEIEAFGREPGLYTRWVDASGNIGNKELDTRD